MSKAYNVAVVGATGLVGQEFLKIALQRGFPLKGLRLLASNRSAGRRLTVGEWEIEVEETNPKSFAGVDLAFFSPPQGVAQSIIPPLPPPRPPRAGSPRGPPSWAARTPRKNGRSSAKRAR